MSSPERQDGGRLGDLSRGRFAAWLCAFTAIGLFERLPIPGPPATLAPTDAYYYGRLAWLSRLAFPAAPTLDTWAAFPGMESPWPPGHAWLLAGIQLLFGVDAPFSARGMLALSWAGPILGLLGVGLLTALASRWFGRWTALVTAGVLLGQPLIADVAQLGEADHHLHEGFAAASLALALARALSPRARVVPAGLWLGLFGGLPYLVTTSGFLLLPPLAAAALAVVLLRHRGRGRLAVTLAAGAAVALAVVFAGALWVGRPFSGDYVRLGGFHVAVQAGLLLATCVPLLFLPSQKLRRLGFLGGAVGLLLFAAAAPTFVGELLKAAGHLGRGSAILAEAAESAPLLRGGLDGVPLQLALTLLPGALILCLAVFGSGRRPTWALPLGGFLAIFVLVTLAQARFARPLLGLCAALAGLMAQQAAARGLPRLTGLAARAAAACLLVPPPVAWQPASDEDAQFLEGVEPALAFLKSSTPSPGRAYEPTRRADWGVLADWNLGHLVVTRGERPAYASPFGQVDEAEKAASTAREILELTDPLEAARRCRELGLAYVLVYEAPPTKPPKALFRKLSTGGDVPGFTLVYSGEPAFEGRVPRVYRVDTR